MCSQLLVNGVIYLRERGSDVRERVSGGQHVMAHQVLACKVMISSKGGVYLSKFPVLKSK